jgi:cation transport ATPase
MSDKSKPLTLSERLNSTGNKLAELSKKVSESTKSAVGNANESIKNAISENKQKRDAKKLKKLEDARTELSSEGLLNDIPSMVTLPEFEQERISIVSEQNDNLVLVLEEMQRLSERVDMLEKRVKKNDEIRKTDDSEEDNSISQNQYSLKTNITRSVTFTGITMLIGAILFFVSIKYQDSNELILGVPSVTMFWFVTMLIWVFFTTKTIDKQTPMFNLSNTIHFVVAISSGLGASLLFEFTNGDLVNMSLLGLFLASVSFTCILVLGVIGPLQNSSNY